MSRYQLEKTSFPALPSVHSGTGNITSAKNIVVPDSVARDVSTQLDFVFTRYKVTVMSFEIHENVEPNWFGVAFRQGISSYNAVNIFFHPSPGGAGMQDTDYHSRGGNWPLLFRYAEMLGSQLSIAENDQIIIIPFFSNSSYMTTGIFAHNWYDIVCDIATVVFNENSLEGPILVSDVVLSDFSRGRQIMHTFRARAPDLRSHLREIWDFDGVGGDRPYSLGGVRGILYDQHTSRDAFAFHVPPSRWLGFHHRVVPNVHSNIPDMLAWHSATVSSIG
jgi:hypothetical protein